MLNRFSLVQKMLGANAIFGVVLCSLLYLLVSAKSEPIDFASQELKGNLFQTPLEKVFFGVSQHRVLTQRAQLSKTPLDLEKVRSFVDQSFQEAEKVESQVGGDLQFTEEGLKQRKRESAKLDLVKKQWLDLKK